MARTTLNATDIATLKAFIIADPVLSTKISGPGTDLAFVSNSLNADAAGPVKAWMIAASANTLDSAADYTLYDSLSQGKRDEWEKFLQYAPRDMSPNKARAVVVDSWIIQGANAATQTKLDNCIAAILNACTFNASVAENVIGGTARSTDTSTSASKITVSALDLKWIGSISINDVALIIL